MTKTYMEKKLFIIFKLLLLFPWSFVFWIVLAIIIITSFNAAFNIFICCYNIIITCFCIISTCFFIIITCFVITIICFIIIIILLKDATSLFFFYSFPLILYEDGCY